MQFCDWKGLVKANDGGIEFGKVSEALRKETLVKIFLRSGGL